MLKRAVAKLQKLTKSEITELKTIRKPSPAVYKLMECVCIIMEIPPKRVKIQGSVNEYQEDYWPSASSKQVLSNFQLIEILSNYNPERLN
jgi:dynein heavy chain